MTTVHYSVRVHTCKPLTKKGFFKPYQMEEDERYIKTTAEALTEQEMYLGLKENEATYLAMPKKCNCRKWLTIYDADALIKAGQALWFCRSVNGVTKLCEPYRDRKNKMVLGHIWRPVEREKVPRIDLITRADIERAFIDGKQDSVILIEEIHKMIMDARAKLIVPFREDPFEGRCLFLFGSVDRIRS